MDEIRMQYGSRETNCYVNYRMESKWHRKMIVVTQLWKQVQRNCPLKKEIVYLNTRYSLAIYSW